MGKVEEKRMREEILGIEGAEKKGREFTNVTFKRSHHAVLPSLVLKKFDDRTKRSF